MSKVKRLSCNRCTLRTVVRNGLAAEDIKRFELMLSNAEYGPIKRGSALAGTGATSLVSALPNEVSARVQGTSKYLVRLDSKHGSWSCTCPAAADGSFCKHCVATVLELSQLHQSQTSRAADATPTDQQRIEEYLLDLTVEELVAILLEQADYDEQLSSGLLARAMAADGEPIDVREWKKKVTKAFRGPGGFIDWRKAGPWSRGVHDMLDVLFALLGAGHTAEVAALAEHAHKRCEAAMTRVDDSNGEIISICSVIADLHLQACELGAYPPKKLGKRIADLELSADLDTFDQSAIRYAHLLDEDGLASYRQQVDKAAADRSPEKGGWSGRNFRVERASKAHAIATKDPDRLIEVCTAGGGEPSIFDYIEVIDVLEETDREEEALEWATEGLSLHQWNTHHVGPLRERWAALTKGQAGGESAVEDSYWAEFQRHPHAASVADLLANCVDESAMLKQIENWLDEMVQVFRSDGVAIDSDLSRAPRGWSKAAVGTVGAPRELRAWRDEGLLYDAGSAIEVNLELGNIDLAWSLAIEFGADKSMWERLVALRRSDHPRESIIWAFEKAEMEIDFRDRKRYRRAAKLLVAEQNTIRDRSDEMELNELFSSKMTELARHHDNKPSLLDEFSKARLLLL